MDSSGVYDYLTNTDGRRLHHVIVCYRIGLLQIRRMVSREAKEYVWVRRRQVKGLRAPTVVRNMLSDCFRSQPFSLY
jgi:hypothetical protein